MNDSIDYGRYILPQVREGDKKIKAEWKDEGN